jgi:hypothetical protein
MLKNISLREGLLDKILVNIEILGVEEFVLD